MIGAIFDPSVLISAALSPHGTPANLMRRWNEGQFELVVSPRLLDELRHAMSYPKLSGRIDASRARRLVSSLRAEATQRPDPTEPPHLRSGDAKDDYLIALGQAERVAIVSVDRHLLELTGRIPVFSPRGFADFLDSRDG